jgi:hypothetical protein
MAVSARVSQVVGEVVVGDNAQARATQVVGEVVVGDNSRALVSQVAMEVLMRAPVGTARPWFQSQIV